MAKKGLSIFGKRCSLELKESIFVFPCILKQGVPFWVCRRSIGVAMRGKVLLSSGLTISDTRSHCYKLDIVFK